MVGLRIADELLGLGVERQRPAEPIMAVCQNPALGVGQVLLHALERLVSGLVVAEGLRLLVRTERLAQPVGDIAQVGTASPTGALRGSRR